MYRNSAKCWPVQIVSRSQENVLSSFDDISVSLKTTVCLHVIDI